MEEEDEGFRIFGRQKAVIQKSDKGLEDQLQRLENVERLADIIHALRVKNARSIKIAYAIIEFVKKGEG